MNNLETQRDDLTKELANEISPLLYSQGKG